MATGKFVISLDFEIYWGVRDAVTLKEYEKNLLGVQKVIPELLELFEKYNIQATFATVGFLFFETKKDLLINLPERKPVYDNANLSPYNHFDVVGENEKIDPFHFANKLIKQVADKGQEIGSHSFSHYYCLEKGPTPEDFREDVRAAKTIGAKNGIELKSFVFPRNQYSEDYIKICNEIGFSSFRGNEKSWLFSSENFGDNIFWRRPFRLLDSYWNFSGHNCYSLDEIKKTRPFNIPSSRFLRPAAERFNAFEKLRLNRITESMTFAAKKGLVYHLWWHPHNFGSNIESNICFLEKILIHYQGLKNEFHFESVNMGLLSKKLINEEA